MNATIKIESGHPTSEAVFIVGLNARNNCKSFEFHFCCGKEMKVDAVVRFHLVQVKIQGQEEKAIAAYWVTDGIDRYRIGFLNREEVKHAKKYEGKLAQIVVFLSNSDDNDDRLFSEQNAGACKAVLIEAVWN